MPKTAKMNKIAHISVRYNRKIDFTNFSSKTFRIGEEMPQDLIYLARFLSKAFKKNWRLNFELHPANFKNLAAHGICCFTDGSKTEHGTDGGFVISNPHTTTTTEHSFKMKDYCTVFQAETAAIKHAAEELITFNNQQITFWSDSLSQSALQALSNKALTAIKHSPNLHTKIQYNLNG